MAHVRPEHRSDNPECYKNWTNPDKSDGWYRDWLDESIKWERRRSCICCNWEQFNASIPFDAVVPGVEAMLRCLSKDITIIMTSGRDGSYRHLMLDWIRKNSLPINLLYMRSPGDQRKDSIVKTELYHEFIEPDYDVQFVIDDRPSVVQAWKDLGLSVIAVTDPAITPPIATQGAT